MRRTGWTSIALRYLAGDPVIRRVCQRLKNGGFVESNHSEIERSASWATFPLIHHLLLLDGIPAALSITSSASMTFSSS